MVDTMRTETGMGDSLLAYCKTRKLYEIKRRAHMKVFGCSSNLLKTSAWNKAFQGTSFSNADTVESAHRVRQPVPETKQHERYCLLEASGCS
jgi:NifU-like protein involved in Fe-S cluster formation